MTKNKVEEVTEKLYKEVITAYKGKFKILYERTTPVFRDIVTTRGEAVDSIAIPFTDGKKMVNVVASLKKLLAPESRELEMALEKNTSLSFIDNAWREHLRQMDDLRQNVQNAVYEQKDPLILYKFEGFNLFKKLISRVNMETVSFLFRADIPVHDASEVRNAPQPLKQAANKLRENKEEAKSLLSSGGGSSAQATQQAQQQTAQKVQPLKSQKIANGNDRVSVQYMDGTVKRDVKFKTVEDDINANKCVLLDE